MRRLARRTGRRGAFLLFLVILDLSYGYALTTSSVAALRSSPDLLLPVHAWGWIWITAGAVIATGIPLRRDRFQFTVASLIKAAWAAVNADVWIIQHGMDAWVSVVVWASFALTVLVVASWPEYTPPPGPGCRR